MFVSSPTSQIPLYIILVADDHLESKVMHNMIELLPSVRDGD